MKNFKNIESALMGENVELSEGQRHVFNEVVKNFKRSGNISSAMGCMADAEIYQNDKDGESKMLAEWLEDDIEADMEDGYSLAGMSYSAYNQQRGMRAQNEVAMKIKAHLENI